MALATKKKRGLRLLKHEGLSYYWKVKNDYAKAELEVLVGLENKPALSFKIRVSFVDPSLYFPWFAAAQAEGKDVITINELEKISPKFIVEAIDFANAQSWQEKKKFVLVYQGGAFILADSKKEQ
jgi:hypothetical protein